ncbi:MAG: hypothetical protein ABJB74_07645 [Gemmatimonas sp.]
MLRIALLLSTIAVGSVELPSYLQAQRAACSVLTLEEVRAIVTAPVDVFAAGSSAPTTSNGITTSNCTYVMTTKNSRGARVTLMWGTSAKLSETNAYYVKRNKELSAIHGDVLILASVTQGSATGLTYDRPASEKLLAATLKKLSP